MKVTTKKVIRLSELHQNEGNYRHGYCAALQGLGSLILGPCVVPTA